MKHRKALKTRRHTQRGGVMIFGKEITVPKITLPFGKKNTPVTSSGAANRGANVTVSGVNPMAKNLNARKANVTMNKIQAELNKLKQQNTLRNRGSIASDPGSVATA
jgi:hypothetical protein